MENLIRNLKNVLADTYSLYLKTQNYHWNVEGKSFKSLHSLFEEHYDDLAEAIDTVAELIRGLGTKAPGTFSYYMKISHIKDGNENASDQEMLHDLYHDQLVISDTLNEALKAAQDTKDEVIISFLVDRLTIHRKNAWMLKSILA